MNKILFKTLAMGALSGMRTFAAPTLLSHFLSQEKTNPLQNTPLQFLGNSTVALALKGFAGGEMMGDKFPGVPDRIVATSLMARGASGALVGAAIYRMHKEKAAEGAVAGAMAAIGATFATFYLRRFLRQHTSMADPLLGAIEDALVVGAGIKAAQL